MTNLPENYILENRKVKINMPYKIEGLNVVDESGKVVGSHKTSEEALTHMETLMANVPDAKKKAEGRGFGGGDSLGPGGKCTCPECGKTIEHKIGVACNKTKCPACGALMGRVAKEDEPNDIEKEKNPSKEYFIQLWKEVKKHLPEWLYEQFYKTVKEKPSLISITEENTSDMEVGKMKYDNEKQIVYSVVYAPGEVDTQGDWATAETIEKAAHNFLANHRKISLDHKTDIEEYDVVESYTAKQEEIWKNEKGETQKVVKGSWILGTHIKDSKLWKSIKSGEKYTGYSLEGKARHGEENAPVLRYEMTVKYSE